MKALGNRKWEMGSRKQYRIGLLTLGFTLVLITATAQIAGKSIPELRQEMSASVSNIPSLQYSNISFTIYHLPITLNANSPISPYAFKPLSLYTNSEIPNLHRYEHLPIFCKIEVKMEQAAKFPIKVRLGDVEYVDRLEGKRQ